tara:strand:+ start:5633 stop:7531 length:1899 start_codon:yes stop_codon:yes gene_type:complete
MPRTSFSNFLRAVSSLFTIGLLFATNAGGQIMTQYDSMTVADLLQRANGGDERAQYRLANRYANGVNGVEADQTEAVKWFTKSANSGFVFAQIELGYRHQEDKETGVARDDALAASWFQKAAGQGQGLAQYEYGRCLYEGRGITADPAKGVQYLQKAADQGDLPSRGYLALAYFEGKGVPKDDAKAKELALRPAYANDRGKHAARIGAYVLGLVNTKSDTLPRNYADGARWLKVASEYGNADAMYHYAQLLLSGEGGVGNTVEGHRWMANAAQAGQSQAVARLKPTQPEPVKEAPAPAVVETPKAKPGFVVNKKEQAGTYKTFTSSKSTAEPAREDAPLALGGASATEKKDELSLPITTSVPAESTDPPVKKLGAGSSGLTLGNPVSADAGAGLGMPGESSTTGSSTVGSARKPFTDFSASPGTTTKAGLSPSEQEKERAAVEALKIAADGGAAAPTPSPTETKKEPALTMPDEATKSETGSAAPAFTAKPSAEEHSEEPSPSTTTSSAAFERPGYDVPFSNRSEARTPGAEFPTGIAIMTLAAACAMSVILLLFFFTFKTRLSSLEAEIRRAQFELSSANLHLSSMMQQIEQVAHQLPENASREEEEGVVSLPDWESTQSNAQNFKISRTR